MIRRKIGRLAGIASAFTLLAGAGWLIGQQQAEADTPLFTATTQISNDGATAAPAYTTIWAFDGQNIAGGSDPFTRTITVNNTPASTCNSDFSTVIPTTDTCYTASIADSGPFRTVVNAIQPNQGTTNASFASGDTISHNVAGTFTGSASYVFYAPTMTPAAAVFVTPTLDDANAADFTLTGANSTNQWYLQAFPVSARGGVTGKQLNNWTWTYTTSCNEVWTDAFGDGNATTGIDSYGQSSPLSTFGEITGASTCPTPTPSPSPSSTGTGTPPPAMGNFGNEVNAFGNGFDVFRQHYAYNAIIAGWPANNSDPATLFIRINRGAGVWQFEATRAGGVATGLCVSDPGYDAAGTGLTDGLVLRGCNTGPWQQFKLLSGEPSQLQDVATGMVVRPDGTGSQLRGSSAANGGTSDHYTWKDNAHLP